MIFTPDGSAKAPDANPVKVVKQLVKPGGKQTSSLNNLTSQRIDKRSGKIVTQASNY